MKRDKILALAVIFMLVGAVFFLIHEMISDPVIPLHLLLYIVPCLCILKKKDGPKSLSVFFMIIFLFITTVTTIAAIGSYLIWTQKLHPLIGTSVEIFNTVSLSLLSIATLINITAILLSVWSISTKIIDGTQTQTSKKVLFPFAAIALAVVIGLGFLIPWLGRAGAIPNGTYTFSKFVFEGEEIDGKRIIGDAIPFESYWARRVPIWVYQIAEDEEFKNEISEKHSLQIISILEPILKSGSISYYDEELYRNVPHVPYNILLDIIYRYYFYKTDNKEAAFTSGSVLELVNSIKIITDYSPNSSPFIEDAESLVIDYNVVYPNALTTFQELYAMFQYFYEYEKHEDTVIEIKGNSITISSCIFVLSQSMIPPSRYLVKHVENYEYEMSKNRLIIFKRMGNHSYRTFDTYHGSSHWLSYNNGILSYIIDSPVYAELIAV